MNKLTVMRGDVNNWFVFGFGLVFYSSWIYQVSALGPGWGSIFGYGKNIIILCLMLLMAISINWRIVKLDVFAGCCIAWFAFCLIFWATYQEPANLYFRRIGQIVFAFLFVTYLRQYPEKNPCLGEVVSRWFSPWIVFAAVMAIIVLNLTTSVSVDVANGFGNSRVNLSIWLVQIVALVLFARLLNNESGIRNLLVCLILIAPAYILQNMTGGRSGLVGSFVLVAFFSWRQGGFRALVIAGIWLYVLSVLVAKYHPLINIENNLSVFRNMNASDLSTFSEVFSWVDRISSYRLSLIVTAFSSLDVRGWFLGVGLGNFVGWVPTYPQLGIVEVHNVFLKIFGEYGGFGFLVFLILVVWPVAYKPEGERQSAARYLQLTYFLIAMIHPDLLMTAINLSFVYLSCLAISLNSRKPSESRGKLLDSRRELSENRLQSG